MGWEVTRRNLASRATSPWWGTGGAGISTDNVVVPGAPSGGTCTIQTLTTAPTGANFNFRPYLGQTARRPEGDYLDHTWRAGFWVRPEVPLLITGFRPYFYSTNYSNTDMGLREENRVLPANQWTWLEGEWENMPEVGYLYLAITIPRSQFDGILNSPVTLTKAIIEAVAS